MPNKGTTFNKHKAYMSLPEPPTVLELRRRNMKWTRAEVANMLSCSLSAYSRFESGRIASIGEKKRQMLSRIMEIPVQRHGIILEWPICE